MKRAAAKRRDGTRIPLLVGILSASIAFSGCMQNKAQTGAPPSRSSATFPTLSPSTTTIAVSANVTFAVSGGTAPYSFSVNAGGAGGSINGSGKFVAPGAAGTTVVTVIDSLGNTGTATITILGSLTVTPSASVVLAAGTSTITPTGGTAPYTYRVVSGGAGGTISVAGLYTAPGATGSDVISVTDAIGRTGTTTITVNAALSLAPTTPTITLSNTKTFTAAGGVPPYVYSIQAGGTAGGSVTAGGGVYTPTIVGADTVKVTDANLNTATQLVTVNAALAISPASLTITPKQTNTFAGTGGVPAYTYTVVAGGAGGSITAGGVYTPPLSSGTDTVKVTDANGNTSTATVTILAPPPKITVGQTHACRTNSTELQCWGLNSSGQLGDGTVTQQYSPESTYPGVSFYSVGNGYTHSCAITAAGVLMCTGGDTSYQLGDNTNSNRAAWEVIDSGTSYAQISGGRFHTCGITTAGVLKCWGTETTGQLGDGAPNTAQATPLVIDAGVSYARVSAGATHTCGITFLGVLKCWGNNTNYNLGDNTIIERDSAVTIDAGTKYIEISAGGQHTCGITSTSALKCWGLNSFGQVGDGTSIDVHVPTVINSGISFKSVSAGYQNTCGVTTLGALKCWGVNTNYALGDGTTVTKLSPQVIDSSTTYSSVATSTGDYFGCGITSLGTFKCWGHNANGQVGIGTAVDASTPQSVP